MDVKKPNKLIHEKSPYLLQHAYNPVDWYPWEKETFEKATMEDKPIFLSIGYSTCHWCHVMEKESFDDDEVAKLLNDFFICIKVDREERPDIDSVYMDVCQLFTGSGGWPLTIIMDSNKIPFFASTYIPKTNRFGKIGLIELLPKIKYLWENEREKLNKTKIEVQNALNKLSNPKINQQNILYDSEILDIAFQNLKNNFNSQNGGFGLQPKFPTPRNLIFLLHYWRETGNYNALKMVEKTLDAMYNGGIYDNLGFGFHRYSTDSEWLVPHFEKMLYDQAMISIAYLEAFLATKNDKYKNITEKIFSYILRDMTSEDGAFFSAEDADSEGEEGKYYLWTYNEISNLLYNDEMKIVIGLFNIKKEGNFIDPIIGYKNKKNILNINKTNKELSIKLNIPMDKLIEKIKNIRQKLFFARENRIKPLKDDKILTDWNGLMIVALSKGGRAFNNEKYNNAAKSAADFIISTMIDDKGNLFHRYRAGERKINGFLDDYAFFVWGLIELYQATFELKYLKTAISLLEKMIDNFWDTINGGFYKNPKESENLIIRKKEIYDSSVPSGNSIAVLDLILLGRITANTKYLDMVDNIFNTFSYSIYSNPTGYILILIGFDLITNPFFEIVIVGNSNSDDTKKMIDVLNTLYLPNAAIILRDGMLDKECEIFGDYIKDMKSIKGKSTAYICKDFNCEIPTTNINKMKELLNKNIGNK